MNDDFEVTLDDISTCTPTSSWGMHGAPSSSSRPPPPSPATASSSSSSGAAPPATQKKLADCVFFAQGSCSRGSACTFRHNPQGPVYVVCKYWLRGLCRNLYCTYAHPPLPPPPPCGPLMAAPPPPSMMGSPGGGAAPPPPSAGLPVPPPPGASFGCGGAQRTSSATATTLPLQSGSSTPLVVAKNPHSSLNNKIPACVFYNSFGCKKGINCPFSHDFEPGTLRQNSQEPMSILDEHSGDNLARKNEEVKAKTKEKEEEVFPHLQVRVLADELSREEVIKGLGLSDPPLVTPLPLPIKNNTITNNTTQPDITDTSSFSIPSPDTTVSACSSTKVPSSSNRKIDLSGLTRKRSDVNNTTSTHFDNTYIPKRQRITGLNPTLKPLPTSTTDTASSTSSSSASPSPPPSPPPSTQARLYSALENSCTPHTKPRHIVSTNNTMPPSLKPSKASGSGRVRHPSSLVAKAVQDIIKQQEYTKQDARGGGRDESTSERWREREERHVYEAGTFGVKSLKELAPAKLTKTPSSH
ncbi:hypothetical protein Pelo_6675 [Pelomyxa schiedti]|nr:hypothetical protein Pelo_6675 [Pelomyxa schiedti]